MQVAIGAAILGGLGAIREGYTNRDVLEAQAAGANRNAEVLRQQAAKNNEEAKVEIRKGDIQANLHEEKTKMILGDLKGRMGASGADFTGSPLEYLGYVGETRGYENQLLKFDAATKAYEKRKEGAIRLDQSKLYDQQADIYRVSAGEAVKSGWMKGLGSIAMAGAMYSKLGAVSSSSSAPSMFGGGSSQTYFKTMANPFG